MNRRTERHDEAKQRIGVLGEKYIFEHERNRLIKAGKKRLAEKVRLISAETDDAGYDVLSFTPKGIQRHIEVKSTAQSQHDHDCFWLSDNEVQRALADPKWTLCRVWRAEGDAHHEELGNIVKCESKDWERSASSWIVRRKT